MYGVRSNMALAVCCCYKLVAAGVFADGVVRQQLPAALCLRQRGCGRQ